MPTYPGDIPTPELKSIGSELNDNISLTEIHLGSHFGTHIDAPQHFYPGGRNLSDFPLEYFFSTAICLIKPLVFNQSIFLTDNDQKIIAKQKPDWLLIGTGFDQFWGQLKYFKNHPSLSLPLIGFLLENGVIGVGCDFPSIDSADAESCNFPVHHKWLGAERMVIENLCNLTQLPVSVPFRLIALPLKMATDGAPTRVVAIL